MSWHDGDGRYVSRGEYPNFIGANGAQAWLAPNGNFENRSEHTKPNYINSAGFALTLNSNGELFSGAHIVDINGCSIIVDSNNIITNPERGGADEELRNFNYVVENKSFSEPDVLLLLTIVAGCLAHPRFGSNGKFANVATWRTGELTTRYWVQGFPYVKFGAWTYKDGLAVQTELPGGRKKTYDYALFGKVELKNKKKIRKPILSASCNNSKYGIMQVGPTCKSTSMLNVLLCSAPLRHHCIKVMNGYLQSQGSEMSADLRLAQWETSCVVRSESLQETILHAIFKRLCGEKVTPSDTACMSALCIYNMTFRHPGYDISKSHPVRGQMVVFEFLLALGLENGVINPQFDTRLPLGVDVDYIMVNTVLDLETVGKWETGTPCVPIKIPNFTLLGAAIGFWFVKPDGDKQPLGGHGAAGIVCKNGERKLFDSNVGEIDIDWVLDPVLFVLHVWKHYHGRFSSVQIQALYFSKTFVAENSHPVPCGSRAPEDSIIFETKNVRDFERLHRLSQTLDHRDSLGFSVASGSILKRKLSHRK